MYLRGNLLVFLAGALSCIWALPQLQDNGYRNILVYVGHDVPDEDANTVVEMTKHLLTEASNDMYYAMNGRAYIAEVTIVVPNHWTQEMVPSLNGVTTQGEIYQEADIQIGKKNKLRGEAPYTQQIRGDCGAPKTYGESAGEPIQISLEYLKGLHYKRDEMVVNYGPMGKLIMQEFAKYHHGIYEEYGHPGKQDAEENAEKLPSLYLHSFVDTDGIKKMGAVPNYCADVNLKGDNINYEITASDTGNHLSKGECVIDDESGEIISPHCYFHADATGQESYSSIGSIQYTDDVLLFCDGTEYFPHNHEQPNMHNDYCDGASQWETIESHFEFEDGSNPPAYIEDTTPTFFTKSQNSARFVLVLDYSGSMQSYARMDHLKTTATRWIRQLKAGTQVAVVRFAHDVQDVHDWVDVQSPGAQTSLINAINRIVANGKSTCMSCGLKRAEELMTNHNGHAGVVMLVTDGYPNSGTAISDESVWSIFKRTSIRVLTVLMGTHKNADIETLARETKGKVFTVNYDGSDLDGPFEWASQTYIPPEVANRYEWSISDTTIQGRDLVAHAATCDHFHCLNDTSIKIDGQTNRDVSVIMRLNAKPDGNKNDEGEIRVSDYIEVATVKDDTGSLIDGFHFSTVEETNQALLRHSRPVAGDYSVDIKFKKPITPTFVANVKVSGHRSSPSSEPYIVECQYPDEIIHIEDDVHKFLITGVVKQGQTTVKGATLYARISKSMDEDSGGEEDPCFAELMDDGLQQLSGDLARFDGVHSHILDPRNCFKTPPANGQRMQVMCTMISSTDTKVTDDNFFSKKVDAKGLPMDSDAVTPYCCGTSNQTWFHQEPVKHVLRDTFNTSVQSKLTILQKDWLTADFGPPGRISDLLAKRLGDQRSGIVQLKWTGAGNDPAYGTPSSYIVHYSTKRSNLYTKNLKKSSQVSSSMLRSGSLDPVPIGGEMNLTVAIPSLEIPGTYHFAVQAVDSHGNEAKASNIVTVNFHDGSPVVRDVSPLHVHGIQTSDAPLIDKLRKRYKDERIVQGFLKKAEKTKQMVWEAENSVMEKRLRERFGNNEKVMANIINTIKNNPDQRNAYKKILL